MYRNSEKTFPTRTEGQVGNKGREGKIVQDGLIELLDASQMVKEFGPRLTGNGESCSAYVGQVTTELDKEAILYV